MDVEYYYSREGRRFGPVPAEKLKELVGAGQLTPGDLVWKEGLPNWIQAGRVKGLFPIETPSASGPPPLGAAIGSPSAAAPASPSARSSEATDAAREFGRQAKDVAVAVSADAWKAVTTMARNPVGGLREAFDLLGPLRAMYVGIVFAVVFDLCFLLGMRLLLGGFLVAMSPMAGGRGPAGMAPAATAGSAEAYQTIAQAQMAAAAARNAPQSHGIGFVDYLKLAILGAVLIGCAIGGFAVVRSIFMGKRGIYGDIFLAGASLLPWGLACLLIGILGGGNSWILPIPIIFGLTTTVLMTYSGCTTLQEAPEAVATLAVPLILLADIYACEIIGRIFY